MLAVLAREIFSGSQKYLQPLPLRIKHGVMNRGRLNKRTAKHGVVSHPLHQDHQKQQKARAARKVTFQAYGIKLRGEEYPDFRSNVSAIGSGRNFICEAGKLKEVSGDKWIVGLQKAGRAYSWYHQRQVRKGVPGYYVRKLRDRSKLGATDKHGRNDTDIERETLDLRPDHSRMIEHALAAGHVLDPALAEIRDEKIRLFQEIYGRSVLFTGEHPDSGQYHHDLWHCGIYAATVDESGNVVLSVVIAPQENQDETDTPTIRVRVPFRAFGVSVGMTSFDRHRSALADSGMEEGEIKECMGKTLDILKRNIEAAKKQNGEDPRDLKLRRALDAFVAEKLRDISPEIYDQSLAEYREWIRAGYEGGHLGVQESLADPRKERQLAKLKAKLERRKNAANRLITRVRNRSDVTARKLEAEISILQKVFQLIREFLLRLVAAPDVIRALKKTGSEIWDAFTELSKELKVEVPETVELGKKTKDETEIK